MMIEIHVDEWLEKGDWVKAPGNENEEGLSAWMWEDFAAAGAFLHENPSYHVYTIIEAEGGHILKGARWVNRFAYLISKSYVELGVHDSLVVWPADPDDDMELVEVVENTIEEHGFMDVFHDWSDYNDEHTQVKAYYFIGQLDGEEFEFKYQVIEQNLYVCKRFSDEYSLLL